MKTILYIGALLLCLAAAAQTRPDGARSKTGNVRMHYPADSSRNGFRPPLRESRRVRLLFAGDLMQHLPQVAAARQADGSFDYSPTFEYIAPLFKEADLAVVNLETTLTDEGVYSGYPCFRSPTALADALARAGVDVCVMANNHCCDGGAKGIRTTLRTLDSLGIARTGVFADSADLHRHHPLRLTAGTLRIALLNYTYGTNGIPVPAGFIVNRIDTAAMLRDLQHARNGETDAVVVCIHWGNEYERQENSVQRRLAAFLRRHGTDIIIGSHPHVVQPFETDGRSAVFYSLGNFVSNQRRRYCNGGLVASVEVARTPVGYTEIAAETVPVWVLLPGYRILPPSAADTLRMGIQARTEYIQFMEDTRELPGLVRYK